MEDPLRNIGNFDFELDFHEGPIADYIGTGELTGYFKARNLTETDLFITTMTGCASSLELPICDMSICPFFCDIF